LIACWTNLKMKYIFWFLLLLPFSGIAQILRVQETEQAIKIDNGIVAASFNKTNADLNSLSLHGVNLLGKGGRAYLLAPDFNMNQSVFSIAKKRIAW